MNPSSAQSPIRNRRGFSLVESLIATAFLLGGAMIVSQGFSSSNQAERNSRNSAAQIQIYEEIQHSAVTPLALYNSAQYASNTGLRRCLGLTAGACPYNSTMDLEIYSAANIKLSGTPSNPVYYTVDGKTCPTPGTNCPLQATSEFKAFCVSGNPCNVPSRITFHIFFTVSLAPAAVTAGVGTLPRLGPTSAGSGLAIPANANRVLTGI